MLSMLSTILKGRSLSGCDLVKTVRYWQTCLCPAFNARCIRTVFSNCG